MSVTRYARSLIPEPVTLLGLQLKPFCLGHYLLMRRFNIGFACEEEKQVSPDELAKDFLLAVVICSVSYEEFLTAIETDRLSVSPNKTVSFRKWVGKWGREIAKASRSNPDFVVLEKLALFRKYLAEAMQVPAFFPGENASDRVSNAHWSETMLVIMVKELGYTHSEAINLPLSRVFNEYFRFAEQHGFIELMTDEELAQAEVQAKALGGQHASN